MGYYTHYTGDVTGPDLFLDAFEVDAANGKTFGQYGQPIMEWLDGDFFGGDTGKWYDWEKDMKSISAEYPYLLFALEGEGEEAGDMWKAWARNGKVVTVRAKIVFDEPNLDETLPAPDVEAAIAKLRQEKRDEIEAEIARLQNLRDAL